ncbi:polysulfide reductase NrfD [Streptomyces sp. WAC 00631]|uniref:NrfD/PsrC family molybdoenzyme membrane anchor subunit n=1 Tax=unclassified Streptomyces TaxID=2593676 RepID=UPI00163C1ED7|nr:MULTISPECIES: NrfD/PsrC family molybdoenzyme membrane anchor subunit [unclassified Streptomyces]MCC5036668.1 polysulfide reductase NrfD [Streptomyces sp. WAC 00631]MCC9738191.1 polysulfide reductase NrfD [Streptomyces sp. MNU89]
MTDSDVTKDGVRGERAGREAVPDSLQPGGTSPERSGEAAAGKTDRKRRRGKRRGEEPMVPRAEFESYYGRPVIKAPGWEATDIAGYFFAGGLAGAGSVLAAGARLSGRPTTAKAMKLSSLAAVTASTAALIHDLGRPERFANMLRVFKPTSPMSVGSWLLAAYGPAAGAAAVLETTGRLPRINTAATGTAALLGPVVAAYTAVLAADTAVPAWHEAHRELPYVFVSSATAAASGMALVTAPVRENAPARRAAVLAAAGEAAALRLKRRRLGMIAETYERGKAGKLMRAAELLTAGGALGAAVLGRRYRSAAAVSGLALLAGSACTRFGVFHAGVASAEDPAYTVVPQRERRERRAAEAAARVAGGADGDSGARDGQDGQHG